MNRYKVELTIDTDKDWTGEEPHFWDWSTLLDCGSGMELTDVDVKVVGYDLSEDKEYEIYQGQRDGQYWITDGEGNPNGPYDSIEDAQKNVWRIK